MLSAVPPITVHDAEQAVMVAALSTTLDWLALTTPGVPVAVKFTGLPVSPVEVADRVFAPAVVPKVQLATAAMPLGLV